MGQLDDVVDFIERDQRSIYRNRPIYLTGSAGRFSAYDDDVWDLSPLVPLLQQKAIRVSFRTVPLNYRPVAKAFAFALLVEDPPEGESRWAPASVAHYVRGFRDIAKILVKLDVQRLSDIDNSTYEALLSRMTNSAGRLSVSSRRALVLLYLYRDLVKGDRLAADPRPHLRQFRVARLERSENSTARISEELLIPLISWATAFVRDLSGDIITARSEYITTRLGHPKFIESVGLANGHEQLMKVLERYRTRGLKLPGHPPLDGQPPVIYYAMLASQSRCSMDVVQRFASRDLAAAIAELGVDDDAYLMMTPTGRLDGELWTNRIRFWDVPNLIDNLYAACYILIAFYSGMRDAEVKHLERGCLRTVTEAGMPDRFEVTSRTFKNRRDPSGDIATWVVGQPAALAIKALESIAPEQSAYLFTKTYYKRNWMQDRHEYSRRGSNVIQAHNLTNKQIATFQEWVRTYCAETGRENTIPLIGGQSQSVSTSRFRRTIAWFIARRPGGSIAGAIQYQHLSIQMFEGYAGTSRAGFRAEVESEAALLRGESMIEMINEHKHEQLTGPARNEAMERMEKFGRAAARFPGLVAENEDQVRQLMAEADPMIYAGTYVTCIFDASRAVCVKGRREDAPNLGRCDPLGCANVALSESNRSNWQKQVEQIDVLLVGETDLAPHVEAQLKKARATVIQKFGVSANAT